MGSPWRSSLVLAVGCATPAGGLGTKGAIDSAGYSSEDESQAPAIDVPPLVETGEGEGEGEGEAEPEPCAVDDRGWLPMDEREFVLWDSPIVETREPCTGVIHAVAGPVGATLSVQLDSFSGPAWVQVEDIRGGVLTGPHRMEPGQSAPVTLVQSGEVLVRLQPDPPNRQFETEPSDVGFTVTCTAGCDTAYTRYPLVLMHGMAGDDAWIGVFDYFVGVEDFLADAGYLAIAPGVDAFNTVDNRAREWQGHLDTLEAEGLGRKFVLVGHSQGGLDARYLASVLGDPRVAAIVTVGTPHRGTAVADLAAGIITGVPGLSWATDAAVDLLASIFGLGGAEFTEQVQGLSRPAAEAFNEDVPDVPGLYYASWAGRTCSRLDWVCILSNDGEIADSMFDLTTLLLNTLEGDNDGLVPVESAKWGDFRGVVPADHIDQVGISDPLATAPFDHLAFYREEAARLAALGF